MSRRFRAVLPAVLTAVAAVLALAAVWLVLHNPSIDGTSRGDDYTCVAPYDTVLNGHDNVPGGEPPPDSDRIASRCRAAGERWFAAGVATGAAAGVVLVVAAGLGGAGLVARRRRPRGTTTGQRRL